jgi:hypothetical protein
MYQYHTKAKFEEHTREDARKRIIDAINSLRYLDCLKIKCELARREFSKNNHYEITIEYLEDGVTY